MKNKTFFFENLIKWNINDNKRQMPWKGEKNPYKIWISEIILQQTRVQQGLAYYNNFIKKWPDVKSLATANEQDVYKAWEGLGYYTRCNNLIAAAKYIHYEMDDKFPDKYEDILSLKGVGNYTASAIASFAFDMPYAVLDGNVYRVLARFFGIDIPVDSSKGKKNFSELASDLIDKKNPAAYNQAIMDFGAVICKPMQPLCEECTLREKCIAYNNNLINVLPVKEKKIKTRNRFFNYFIIKYNDKVYINKRIEKDIWKNLYEFVLIESNHFIDEKKFLKDPAVVLLLNKNKISHISKIFKQKLTHQNIQGRFLHVEIKSPLHSLKKLERVRVSELKRFPFPKFITSYLQD